LNKKDFDALWARLRALENPSKAVSEESRIHDIIFDRLRNLEEKTDELRAWHYKMLGAYSAVTVIAGALYKIFVE